MAERVSVINLSCPNCGGTLSLEKWQEVCQFCSTPVLIRGFEKREAIRSVFTKGEAFRKLKEQMIEYQVDEGFITSLRTRECSSTLYPILGV